MRLSLAAALALAALPLRAQPPADATARVTVTVRHDGAPVRGAQLRALDLVPPPGALTGADGVATLALPAGARTVVVGRLGLRPDTLRLVLRAGQDTTIAVTLDELEGELETVVVAATRGERRVEDVPLRVEVIDEEEIAEKVAMTPGDITMMLNETSGLRVQTTSPSLGAANVRVQGLRGRYSLVLADGLPLHGGAAGGLGLLQIPPMDLGRVEVVKGTASALHGGAALGGVINLLSRRPGAAAERELLVNATSRGGADGVLYAAAPVGEHAGWTLLAGAHGQRANDLDADAWADMPGYRRAVVRPRVFLDDGAGRTAFLTAGYTAESRHGGTLRGRATPDGRQRAESLGTRRADVGAVARWVAADGAGIGGLDALRGAILTLRGSATEQRHAHRFGDARERDRHRTAFGEAAIAVPRGATTWVGGVALVRESYAARDLAGLDYAFTVPAAFAQVDADPAPWLSASASARVDAHSAYGTIASPRLSLLVRPAGADAAGWTARLSGGTGFAAPTPFTDETEATGLAPLLPLRGLRAERARSASLDVGGPLETAVGRLEVNATAFGSAVDHAVQTRRVGADRLELRNADVPARAWGAELLARLVRELGEGADGEEAPALRVTATYTFLRATECDPDATGDRMPPDECARREVPLTPRHAAGLVASVERHGAGRVGVEVYHTGRQPLADDPYRTASRPYTIVGVLAERVVRTPVGAARVFVNLENLGDVRQTRVDPLLLPAGVRGPGGRLTTDVWSPLDGRVVNGGVRLAF